MKSKPLLISLFTLIICLSCQTRAEEEEDYDGVAGGGAPPEEPEAAGGGGGAGGGAPALPVMGDMMQSMSDTMTQSMGGMVQTMGGGMPMTQIAGIGAKARGLGRRRRK